MEGETIGNSGPQRAHLEVGLVPSRPSADSLKTRRCPERQNYCSKTRHLFLKTSTSEKPIIWKTGAQKQEQRYMYDQNTPEKGERTPNGNAWLTPFARKCFFVLSRWIVVYLLNFISSAWYKKAFSCKGGKKKLWKNRSIAGPCTYKARLFIRRYIKIR